MRRLAAAAVLAVATSCYEPGGQCTADADCLSSQVCGADGLCVPGAAAPPGDPPVAAVDAYAFAGVGPFDVTAASGVLANDVDPDGHALTALMEPSGTTRTAAGGTVFLAPDGAFTYAPTLGFTGADGFSYRATDGVLSSAVTNVSITVAP